MMNVEQGMSKEKGAYNSFDIPCSTFIISIPFFHHNLLGQHK
jgi:hypothetical protein